MYLHCWSSSLLLWHVIVSPHIISVYIDQAKQVMKNTFQSRNGVVASSKMVDGTTRYTLLDDIWSKTLAPVDTIFIDLESGGLFSVTHTSEPSHMSTICVIPNVNQKTFTYYW